MPDTVETSDRYKESDEHVPNPTDLSGTLDTSGTGGSADQNVRDVTKVFDVARARELEVAAKALDPEDDSVPASLVVLPTGTHVVNEDPEAAKERVLAAAEKAKSDPPVVGDPGPSEEAAGEEGDDKAAKAEAEQKQQGVGANYTYGQ